MTNPVPGSAALPADSCAGCLALSAQVTDLRERLTALTEKVAGIQEVNELWDGS